MRCPLTVLSLGSHLYAQATFAYALGWIDRGTVVHLLDGLPRESLGAVRLLVAEEPSGLLTPPPRP